MKYSLKTWMASFVTLFYLLSSFLYPMISYAETSIQTKCGYVPVQGENPSLKTINCLLTEVALAYDVPPEIVKAIAEQESGWQHFTSQEVPLISDDGGIGIMQVTLTTGLDVEKLENDLLYNIEAGVQNLNNSFARKDLPVINDRSRHVIENWYFAIMAYNGTKPVNSPVYQDSGKPNLNAYQEQVMQIIRDRSLLDITPSSFQVSDFIYNPEDVRNIEFATSVFNLMNQPLHTSKYFFNKNDKVYLNKADVRVRQQPNTTSSVLKVAKLNDVATITGAFEYDSVNAANHFTWYPIKLADGTEGYVASSYLSEDKVQTTPNENGTWKVWPTAKNVASDKVWHVELDTKLKTSSINASNIYIKDSNNLDVPATLALNPDGKTIVITPVQSYQSGKTYTLYMKNIESATGKLLKENVKMQFDIQ